MKTTWCNICEVPNTQKIVNQSDFSSRYQRCPSGIPGIIFLGLVEGRPLLPVGVELSVNFNLRSWNHCLLKFNMQVTNTTCLAHSLPESGLGSPGGDCRPSWWHGQMRSRKHKEVSFHISWRWRSDLHFMDSFQHLCWPQGFRSGQDSPLTGETDCHIHRLWSWQQWIFLHRAVVTQYVWLILVRKTSRK